MTIVSGHPLPNLNDRVWVGDYAQAGARDNPERIAFIVPELNVSITYKEFNCRVARAQALLQSKGLNQGDRIAYYGQNSEQFYIVLLAAVRAGIVLIPLNWRCVEKEITFFLDDAECKLIICDDAFYATAKSASENCQASPDILLTEGNASLRAFLDTSEDEINSAIEWQEDTVCLHLYTSGTTGKPKGVLSRHAALSISRFQEYSWKDFPNWHGGTIVSAMPNFHIGGMSWILMGLLRQSTCVITTDPSATNITQLLKEYQAERTFVVPTVVRAIVDELKNKKSSMPWLQTVFYGAAPMSPSLLEDAIETLGCSFGQFFGMTEITGTATFLSPEDHQLSTPRLLKSVGKPYPGVDIEIRNPEGKPTAQGEPGEIWIRSPSIMREYWRRPDATDEVMQNGWYRSGDGGYIDEQGYLFLTDRIKDMIVSGGENVYPSEVEEALRRFENVYEVAVVGVPDEKWGEVVSAAVECKPDTKIHKDELITFIRTQLAAYKCPKNVVIVNALPRTASGKIQRAPCKNLF